MLIILSIPSVEFNHFLTPSSSLASCFSQQVWSELREFHSNHSTLRHEINFNFHHKIDQLKRLASDVDGTTKRFVINRALTQSYVSLSVAAFSNGKFRFINSWIPPTMFNFSVLAEAKTFLIHHLKSIDRFAVSLSAFDVLILINTLGLTDGIKSFVYMLMNQLCHMRNVRRPSKLNFTLAMGFPMFSSEHALPNVRSTNSLNVPEDTTRLN